MINQLPIEPLTTKVKHTTLSSTGFYTNIIGRKYNEKITLLFDVAIYST